MNFVLSVVRLLLLAVVHQVTSQISEDLEPSAERNLQEEGELPAAGKPQMGCETLYRSKPAYPFAGSNTKPDEELYRGPWEECEGQDAMDCRNWIMGNVGWYGCRNKYPRSFTRLIDTSIYAYDMTRVWIPANDMGIVTGTPKRG